MAIVQRKLRHGGVTYWVTFTWNGKTIWERSGSSERAAKGLERDRKREVKAGTYSPHVKGHVTTGSWLDTFLAMQTNRTIENDRNLIEDHVRAVEWFASMPLRAVRGRDCLRLVEEIRRAGKLGEKSISTVYGLVAKAFRRAKFDDLISDDPTPLPAGTLKRKSARGNRRRPYPRQDAKLLVSDPRILWPQRVFNALVFYTGMREGEACGRRWRTWDRTVGPLTRLVVDTQYEDQPLKTDDGDDVRPRFVPVHSDLALILDAWWNEGFELFMLRKPTPDDFIVPTLTGGCHSRSNMYKAFRRSLARVGVENRTLHATRNTFISVCRSSGAPPDVVERITHNSRGDVIDEYTEFEWRTLCEAVRLFDLSFDSDRENAWKVGSSSWTRITGNAQESVATGRKRSEFLAIVDSGFSRENCIEGADVGAGQSPAVWALALAAEPLLTRRRVVSIAEYRAKSRAWFAGRAA